MKLVPLYAVVLALAGATPALAQRAKGAPPLDDATIVAIFDAANTRDLTAGQLAVERGTTQEVRDFGAMLARDHAAVRQLGRDLAARLHVTPTPPKHSDTQATWEKDMKRLRRTKGAAFNLAFARHEADYHATVIDEINSTLLPAIKSDSLRALVLQVAPAFVNHQRAAEALAQRLAAAK